MRFLFRTVILFVICSCTRTGKQQNAPNNKNDIPIINLLSIDDATSEEMKANSFFSKISYTPLETKENCLLGESQICYADSTQIVILSESELFRFSAKGLFLNKIGKKGKGAGEYLHPGSLFFDLKTSLFRVVDLQNKRTLWFSLTGDFIKDEAFKNQHKNRFEYCYIDSKNILTSFRCVNEKKNNEVRDELYILNEKNDTLFAYFDNFMIGAKKLSFFYYPSIQQSFPMSFVTLPFNDTIYSVDSKTGFSPIAALYCGKNKIPRHIAEDFSLNKKNRDKYITGVSSLVSNKFIFLSFNKKAAKYVAVFDREKNKIIAADKLLFEDFFSEFRQIGIVDNVKRKGVMFFPEYINNNTAYGLIYDNIEGNTVNNNPAVIAGYLK